MTKYKRMVDETDEELIFRICRDKDIIGTWNDVKDILNELLNADYGESTYRKKYQAFEKMFNANQKTFSNDTLLLNEIIEQKEELYKAQVKYRDKIREYNAKLREESHFENLRDVMIDTIKNSGNVISHSYRNLVSDYTIPNPVEASLLISDIHYGIEINNPINRFNKLIAQERLEILSEKTLEYCAVNQVQKLNVCILGDCISGLIQLTARVEQEEDVITQIIDISELLSEMIAKFARIIPEIRVFTVYGNHGRSISDKKSNVNRENYERLIYHYINTKIDIDNVQFISSDVYDYLTANIGGKNIVMEHGDKGSKCVSDYTNILGYKPDEIYRGHYHRFSVINDNDTRVITNGSVCGTDDYALSLRKATKPSQTLIVYGKDSCIYEIDLT